MSKKDDDKRQAVLTTESDNARKESGLTLTTKQGWLLTIIILIFFGTLLFFGYKDWQRQRQMRQEFEEHLRTIPTSKADEEKRERGLSFPQYACERESPNFPQKIESVRI
ncbi:hypothetical protein L0337_27495 [candidate division KSB1 bacterium]|nr:hypothetical protein [candidate division KSB1 bacterium]